MLLQGLDEIGRTLQQRDRDRRLRAGSPREAVRPCRASGRRHRSRGHRGGAEGPARRGGSVRLPDRHAASTPSARPASRSPGDSLPERTRAAVVEADAVLLGAVGHPALAERGREAASRGRPARPAEAARRIRQPAAGRGPPVAGACVAAPARAARGRGPAHRAGADRRAVLRRAAGAGAGQRGEHPAVHGGGDRAGGAGRVPRRGRAARPADVGGQGERAGSVAALARDGHADGGGGVPGDQARAPVRGFRRHATGRGSRGGSTCCSPRTCSATS